MKWRIVAVVLVVLVAVGVSMYNDFEYKDPSVYKMDCPKCGQKTTQYYMDEYGICYNCYDIFGDSTAKCPNCNTTTTVGDLARAGQGKYCSKCNGKSLEERKQDKLDAQKAREEYKARPEEKCPYCGKMTKSMIGDMCIDCYIDLH